MQGNFGNANLTCSVGLKPSRWVSHIKLFLATQGTYGALCVLGWLPRLVYNLCTLPVVTVAQPRQFYCPKILIQAVNPGHIWGGGEGGLCCDYVDPPQGACEPGFCLVPFSLI